MGITYVELEVANVAKPDSGETLRFLVDSGAVYFVVPTAVLEKLGIEFFGEEEFRLGNGETVIRKKGGALYRYGKRVGVADVVFGEDGDAVLLGALTLKALGLSLDPLKRELRELPMMLA